MEEHKKNSKTNIPTNFTIIRTFRDSNWVLIHAYMTILSLHFSNTSALKLIHALPSKKEKEKDFNSCSKYHNILEYKINVKIFH